MDREIPQIPPERWQQVVDIFGEVKDLSAADRDRLLNQACGGDSQLRREVEDLLADAATAPGRFGECIFTMQGSYDSMTLPFSVGQTVANRYEVLKILGHGGMGAIYMARDHKLESETVVLKVIQPQLAGSVEALQRFTREVRLTREITHKNIVRVFDIGEADGTNFISMEYVDGINLKEWLAEHGKCSARDAIEIVHQICDALIAAHQRGIVHRDLKPQNIMVQDDKRVVVMDFGIAHSDAAPGLTATGTPIGTPEYMSPEQAKGEKADERSDIFSLGLIFYELLTGKLPFKGETTLQTIFKRTSERATPPADLDPSVPPDVNRIVMHCLEIDPANRYSSASDILSDLNAIDPVRPMTNRSWKLAVAVLVGIVLGIGIYFVQEVSRRPAAKKSVVQVLIADFTVEPGVLDTPLEPVLTLALEGASFVEVVDRQRAKTAAASINSKQTALDEETARLVAVREGISTVVSGSLARRGKKLQISGKAIDAATGQVLAFHRVDADDKGSVLAAMARLGALIRSSVGDTTPESIQLAAAETFTVGSLEAMTNYAKAQELRSAGKWEEAIHYYSQAVAVDPKLGRAYAGLAAASFNLGRTDDAETYYKLALANIDRMTEREKYRTRGGYFLTLRDYEQAIEQFKTLVEKFPADAAGRNNLAVAYFYKRDMSKALVEGQQFVSLYPNIVAARNNVALYAMYAGNFETARVEAEKTLQLMPSFVKGYVVTALSDLALGRNDNAARTYEKMAALSSQGASLAATGLADLKMFEGRLRDAEAVLQKAIAADLANKEVASAANKLVTLASVQMSLNRQAAALDSAERALLLSTDLSVVFEAARIFIGARRPAQAASLAERLNSRLHREQQAYARLIEGEILLASNRARDAIRKFEDARQLADTWLGRLDMGRAYVDAGAFAEASSEFDASLNRRGEATAVFLDDVPTYHYFPAVFYYLGRAREGLQSYGAIEQYRTFLDIKARSETDPLVADAKRRVEMLSKQ